MLAGKGGLGRGLWEVRRQEGAECASQVTTCKFSSELGRDGCSLRQCDRSTALTSSPEYEKVSNWMF